eukprot:8907804-Pyramimonas_sp.AAC.1
MNAWNAESARQRSAQSVAGNRARHASGQSVSSEHDERALFWLVGRYNLPIRSCEACLLRFCTHDIAAEAVHRRRAEEGEQNQVQQPVAHQLLQPPLEDILHPECHRLELADDGEGILPDLEHDLLHPETPQRREPARAGVP